MLRFLERFGIGGAESAARQLNVDAARIIESTEGQFGRDTLARVVDIVREQLDEVHRLSLGETQYYEQGLKHLTERNAEHRRKNDQAAWSAVTLAIIYLKAERLGAAAAPACAHIDAFLERRGRAVPGEMGSPPPESGE